MTITVIQINNQFFLPVSNGVQEVPFAIVSAWREEGAEVVIKEGEHYD